MEESRHVIPACGSQGKGEPQQREAGAPELSCGGREGILASPPTPTPWLAPRASDSCRTLPPSYLRGESEALCVAKFQ